MKGLFSVNHCILVSSGVKQTFYPVGNGGSFPGGKVARAWSCPPGENKPGHSKTSRCIYSLFHSQPLSEATSNARM